MTKAIIFAREALQHSNIDTKINKLKNSCQDSKLSKDKLQDIADKIYITQMQENIKAIILKNQ